MHWSNAQDIYADQIADEPSRETARARSRLEYMNAGYIRNAVRSFKTHVIGAKGPVLKITPAKSHPLAPKVTQEEKDLVEWEWYHWNRETRNTEKLKQLVGALVYDGEAFLQAIYDPYIRDVNLNYQEIEAKRIKHPFQNTTNENEIDGVVYDGIHPVIYYVERLVMNPNLNFEQQYDQIPAEQMLGVSNRDLIGQHRGMSIMQCVLQMQADYRKWITYVLGAAEQAARGGTGFIKSQNQVNPDDLEGNREVMGAYIALEPGVYKTLPFGTEPAWQKTDPPSGVESFGVQVTGEIGAGIGSPSGIMRADTSQYNYSSFRGELQNYWTFIAEVQEMIAQHILDVQFDQWFECRASFDETFQSIFSRYRGRIDRLPREWKYAKPPSVDPLHDVQAYEVMLRMGVISLRMICEALGWDYEDVKADRETEAAEGSVPQVAGNAITANAEGDTPAVSAPSALARSSILPPESLPPLPTLLSAQEAGERLHVSASQIAGWRKAGLASYKMGGRVLYSLNDLTDFITKGKK